MSVAKKHAVLLAAFLVFGGHAQAQFKGVAEPVPAMPVAPIAAPAIAAPAIGLSAAPITSAPGIEPAVGAPAAAPAAAAPDTTTAVPGTAPTMMVPGCPEGPDCPPEPEGEGPFSEAVKEMIKEFAKCEAEGKSLDRCLSDDPAPPHLSQLTEEDRMQLTQCLGSSDLSATRERWSGCLVGAD